MKIASGSRSGGGLERPPGPGPVAGSPPDCGGGGADPAAAPHPAGAGGGGGAGADAASRSHVLLPAAAEAAAGTAPSAGPALDTGLRAALWNASAGPPGPGPGPGAGLGPEPAPDPAAGSPEPPDASSAPPPPPPVRTEEAVIVIVVLVLWVAAIALFFNRWGKIRMLEPYQPKYEAPHRGSCPLVDCAGAPGLQHRSFSKFNLAGCGEAGLYSSLPSPHNLLRPRQNSVFVGSATTMVTLPLNPPRKAKSAMDIQTLVLAECVAAPSACADPDDRSAGASAGCAAPEFPAAPEPAPDSNFHAAIRRIDSFKMSNV